MYDRVYSFVIPGDRGRGGGKNKIYTFFCLLLHCIVYLHLKLPFFFFSMQFDIRFVIVLQKGGKFIDVSMLVELTV